MLNVNLQCPLPTRIPPLEPPGRDVHQPRDSEPHLESDVAAAIHCISCRRPPSRLQHQHSPSLGDQPRHPSLPPHLIHSRYNEGDAARDRHACGVPARKAGGVRPRVEGKGHRGDGPPEEEGLENGWRQEEGEPVAVGERRMSVGLAAQRSDCDARKYRQEVFQCRVDCSGRVMVNGRVHSRLTSRLTVRRANNLPSQARR